MRFYGVADCEQLLCFRYYSGSEQELASAAAPALPARLRAELRKLPLRLKEGVARRRGDARPQAYHNRSFEPTEPGPADLVRLSDTVDRCSISNLESDGNGPRPETECDPSKIVDSSLINESRTVNSESRRAPDAPTSSGVKKKCPPPVDTGGGPACDGVKKKSKMNSGLESPTSPGTEYYKIWSPKNPCKIMKFVYEVEGGKVPAEAVGTAGAAGSVGAAEPAGAKGRAGPAAAQTQAGPPLPPRAAHRPLQRSRALEPVAPPQVPRHRKPKKLTRPEDAFTFELIDTDEQFFTDSNISNSSALQGGLDDFEPGEFYTGGQVAVSSTASFWRGGRDVAPLATPETDGSLCESTVSSIKLSRLIEDKKSKDAPDGSPSVSRNRVLFIKDIGPDNYITTTFARKDRAPPASDAVDGANLTPNRAKSEEKAQHTFLNDISNRSEFEDDNRNQIEEKEITTLKGHRPLTRQNSGRANTPTMMTAFLNSSHVDPGRRENGSDAPSSCDSSHSTSPVDETDKTLPSVGTMIMNRKYSCDSSTPKHSSLPRHLLKNLGCEGTPKHSPTNSGSRTLDSPARPHPRALARVAALAGAAPQCPPTPTHHARRPQPATPPDLAPPPVNSDDREDFELLEYTNELRTTEIRSPNMEFANSNHFTIVHAGPPDDVVLRRPRPPEDGDDNENAVASPTPLRHMAGIRLPSIPERASRQMALTGDFPANMIGGIIECEEPLPAGN